MMPSNLGLQPRAVRKVRPAAHRRGGKGICEAGGPISRTGLAVSILFLTALSGATPGHAVCKPQVIPPIQNESPVAAQDLDKARALYEQAIAAGDVRAQEKYAVALIKGEGFEKDVKLGLGLLESAAANSPESKVILGNMLVHGIGIPADEKRGLALLNEAASSGSANALNFLADLYLSGKAVPADPAKAREYYERSIHIGNQAALRRLGTALVEGRGLPPDPDTGMSLLARASDKDPEVKTTMAGYLLTGDFVKADRQRAVSLLKDASAAGNLVAKRVLALVYLEGLHGERDSEAGLRLLIEAAAGGDHQAKVTLARELISGNSLCPDPAAGVKLLRRANDLSADDMIMLGEVLLAGTAVKKDVAGARGLFEAAAKLGNGRGLELLGTSYLKGDFVKTNVKLAQQLLLRAVEAGRTEAWAALARAASTGTFGPKSAGLYELYKKKAIKSGQARIAVIDAQRHFWGRGVPKKPAAGLSILIAAANKGNDLAAREVIAIYRDGEPEVAARNLAKAKAYFKKYAKSFDARTRNDQLVLLALAGARGRDGFEALLGQEPASGRLASPALQDDVWTTNRAFAIYRMQRVLKAKGLYKGDPDGIAGAETRKSMKVACGEAAKDFSCGPVLVSSQTAYRLAYRLP